MSREPLVTPLVEVVRPPARFRVFIRLASSLESALKTFLLTNHDTLGTRIPLCQYPELGDSMTSLLKPDLLKKYFLHQNCICCNHACDVIFPSNYICK